MGLGLLGRGVGDTAFLADQGARLIVTDLKDEHELAKSVKKLEKYENIEFVLGRHRHGDFKRRDIILKSAGVPLKNEYLDTAKESDTEITMSAAWMVSIAKQEGIDVTTIGVTGTKGKSTVTGMIESVLKESGVRYHLAGNVRGKANLPLLKQIRSGDIVLMELDSWQLQGFEAAGISPNISVFTNFFPDHMNYYKGSMKKYFSDKAAIFRNQKDSDITIISSGTKDAIEKYGRKSDQSKHFKVIGGKETTNIKLSVPGEHNKLNAAMASAVFGHLGYRKTTIKSGLQNFKPVEGRLQDLGLHKGVRFINDNNSTTPESTLLTLKAVKELNPKGRIVWFGGGSDKLCDYKELGKEIPSMCDYALLLSGKGTEKIIKTVPKSFQSAIAQVDHMKQAFKALEGLTKRGDVVVFSPAAASFGLFENEYDRNDQFMRELTRFKQ